MRSSDFNVGSVVYFISSKSEQVIPALVAEKIVRTSKDASKVTYILEVTTPSATKSFEVDPTTTDLFSDSLQVKNFMMERAEKAIDALIDAAQKVANKILPPDSPQKKGLNIPEKSDLEKGKSSDEFAEVVLEDGKVARLRI